MQQKELMQEIAANLQPAAATVISRRVLSKDDSDSKMYARLNGGRKKSDPVNEWWGRVELETQFIGLKLGTEYTSHVAGAAVSSGSAETKKEVVVETSSDGWHTWENRFFETDKKTRSKFYLKIQDSKAVIGTTLAPVGVVETYIIDGARYTRKEAEKVLAGYLKPIKEKKPTSTQVNAGVDSDHAIFYYLPKVTDIVYIKQGKYEYTR